MENKGLQEIKELYKELIEIAKVNNPSVYMMPKSFYDGIVSRVLYVEQKFKEANKSRDKWRARAEKAEKELKSLKMKNANLGGGS